MSKYNPLNETLVERTYPVWVASFTEVEKVIGTNLPDSAWRHRAWWANEHGTHVQAKAWLDAGWSTEHVDVTHQTVTFRRAGEATGHAIDEDTRDLNA